MSAFDFSIIFVMLLSSVQVICHTVCVCVCVLPFASVDWALKTNCLFVRGFMFGAGLFFFVYSTTIYFVWGFNSFLLSLFFRRCLSITDCLCFPL